MRLASGCIAYQLMDTAGLRRGRLTGLVLRGEDLALPAAVPLTHCRGRTVLLDVRAGSRPGSGRSPGAGWPYQPGAACGCCGPGGVPGPQ
ncbi:hypothetical protein E4U91_31425 [Streptomyces lasalocidi]|uniref:Uncharacterized protein n=1 Tax=Streptomyces lasalocidi TaxID=324833 RepID=A0A4U5WPK8_STRLS|nr:hypothetical protein E4U91_31425 [Streptomyces lasalocidi]